jgi:hypothetical protein
MPDTNAERWDAAIEACAKECDFLRAGLASDAQYFGDQDEEDVEAYRDEYMGKANIAELCGKRVSALKGQGGTR